MSEVAGLSIHGSMTLIVNFVIKEIYTSSLGRKVVVIQYQKNGEVITESLHAGELLTITYPINAVNGNPRAEETVKKIKEVIKELT